MGLQSLKCVTVVVALAVSACSTTEHARLDQPEDVKSAVQQPLRDLSLLRVEPPQMLREAAAAPYALPRPADCRTLNGEIAQLEGVLGPDVDRLSEKPDEGAEALVAGAVGGLVDLPFSGIVRRISGAEKRDRERREVILASIARRSFLKGAARALSCPSAQAQPSATE